MVTKVKGSVWDSADNNQAESLNTLLNGSGKGPDPKDYGVSFSAKNSAGEDKIYSAIQSETEIITAGSERGRLHFLINDADFLIPCGTINGDGSWIIGPSSAAYNADIAGIEDIAGVTPDGVVFGERLSAADGDYEDARVLAIRNTKITDLTSLGYRVGMGFSILNTDGKERPTAYIRAQYSDRTAGVEDSYLYPTTLANGYQINGPAFSDGTMYPMTDGTKDLGKSTARFKDGYFGGALYLGGTAPANALDDYEEGTWEITATPNGSGTITLNSSFDTGRYVKIGNLVKCNVSFKVSTVSSPVGTSVAINLPFSAPTGAEYEYRTSGSCTFYDASAGTYSSIVTIKSQNSSDIFLAKDASTFEANDEVYISVTYITI